MCEDNISVASLVVFAEAYMTVSAAKRLGAPPTQLLVELLTQELKTSGPQDRALRNAYYILMRGRPFSVYIHTTLSHLQV